MNVVFDVTLEPTRRTTYTFNECLSVGVTAKSSVGDFS